MSHTYSFGTSVVDGVGEEHVVTGYVHCEFPDAIHHIMVAAINELQIGCDGERCTGPYRFTKVYLHLGELPKE